jgi:phage terminase large subunit GpA-like protein
MFATTNDLMRRALSVLAPPPDLTVSQWADKYRRLSAESSASPGRWDTSVTEYLREPMDMVGKPGVREIVMMTSAQVGKSSFVENVIGYFMHFDPCPMLHVSPTLASMKMFSKERLAPMLRDSPALSRLVKSARSRDSENTIETKKFPGGNLAMVGSNAPAGLASRPVRVLVADEVDRFERSAGTEGDPLKLGIKRTTTFWNRVIVYVSTPGNKGESRIEESYERSDMRQRWCPCPHCGHHQVLEWSNVRWWNNDPETAAYVCNECGSLWDDFQRIVAVRKGEWRARKPFNGIVGYHLNQIYSPFARLADGVRDFLECKAHPEMLKTWVNTFLGETWEEKGQRLEWSDVADNRNPDLSEDVVSPDVTVITAAVDMQDDRAEVEFVGWGDDYRSWSIGYKQLYGDPSTPEFWQNLRATLMRTFDHPIFGEIPIRMTCIDSGGHYTQEVYRFSKTIPRCVPIRGVGGEGKPMIGKPSKANLMGTQVFNLGVDTIKEIVVARMKVKDPEMPGFCAFPGDRKDEYFMGLTAEKLMTRFVKGFKKSEWVKVRPRNEPFDLRVYATAALEMLHIDLKSQRRAMLRKAMETVSANVAEHVQSKSGATTKPQRVRQSWLNKWKTDVS